MNDCRRRYFAAHGKALDFSRAWWTPPLSPAEVMRMEMEQMHSFADWNGLVSITDHDTVAGGTSVISMEWTVAFENSFLHLGVHHLPWDCGEQLREMKAFTKAPSAGRLGELLRWLVSEPSTLVVLNHPLWDEKGIGEEAHRRLATDFIERYRGFVHALELNGLRSWVENKGVLDLARSRGLPAISGGDRHTREANAVLNLTNASTFGEFAEEIRRDGCSRVLFMPQYKQSRRLRLAHAAFDVVREYPDHSSGKRLWSDRVFYRRESGVVESLNEAWKGRHPLWLQTLVRLSHLARQYPWCYGLHLALAERQGFAI